MNLGEWIKANRERFGWDQAVLARRMGVTQQTVSRWERDQASPRPRHLSVLVELFGPVVEERPSVASGTPQLRAPRPPLDPAPPTADLSPELFENFVADLAQMIWPDAIVHREGGSASGSRPSVRHT